MMIGRFAGLVRDYLESFGYSVAAAHTGPAGAEKALGEPWQAVILDVMMPGCDGFEVLRQIRRKSDVPVLMLTARGDETDQIAGLEGGADDYLPKGSSTRALLARLHAITRRAALAGSKPEAAAADEIVIAELRINVASRTATLGTELLVLTPGEFDMLLSLGQSEGPREDARCSAGGGPRPGVAGLRPGDRCADFQPAEEAGGRIRRRPRFIRTVRSAGYMLVDPNAP